MAVAGFKIKINGGAFTGEIIDIGFPAPVGGFVEYLKTGFAADTQYTFEAAAYDAWGNLAGWGAPYVYTTPAESLIWENHVQAGWTIDGDQNLSATADSYTPYAPDVVAKFNNVGDFIEFEFTGGAAYGHIRLTDNSGHYIYTYPSSQIDDEIGFIDFYQAYGDGARVRLRKKTASRFEISVNGAGFTEIAKDFTGTVAAHVESLTITGNIIAAPATNIIF